jgi:DNA-binding IclR family transcriptional regulator
VVIARVVGSDWAPRINPLDVGFDQAAHALACGKVMLASLSPGARHAYLSEHGLPALTPRTTTEPQVLERELARVAETGLAADVEEFQLGQACLGVPVVGVNRTVSGCVALSVPAAGFDAARPRLERHLRRAAERTSRALALTS